jgi:hypothetical protein
VSKPLNFFLFFFKLNSLKYTVDRTAKDLDAARQKSALLKKEALARLDRLELLLLFLVLLFCDVVIGVFVAVIIVVSVVDDDNGGDEFKAFFLLVRPKKKICVFPVA